MGCHVLLQGIFPTQGSNRRLLRWLLGAGRLFAPEPRGSPFYTQQRVNLKLLIYPSTPLSPLMIVSLLSTSVL